MQLSVLDLYILSLIDRGLSSRYELQREGGVSLGSSTPALLRLRKVKLVIQQTGTGTGERPRHDLKLSAAGRRAVRSGWHALLENPGGEDVEALLRIADTARHYGEPSARIGNFLEDAASMRLKQFKEISSPLHHTPANSAITDWQDRLKLSRVKAEAEFLMDLGRSHIGTTPRSKSRRPSR